MRSGIRGTVVAPIGSTDPTHDEQPGISSPDRHGRRRTRPRGLWNLLPLSVALRKQ